MAVLQCKMCGGELDIVQGSPIAKCKYCGNINTLPKETNVDNHGIFVRANELRARGEFDLAERIYEKIVENSPEEAEAYWGIVLCKYGIEYVEDPTTKKRIPTCHRASFDAIITDYNYQKAIEYADKKARPIYEEQAKIIDGIQKEILVLSYKEEKYDVFICYKETDENGNRTEDSVIANDIYYQLKEAGYKVFYSAITLEDKLGRDYEPIIFAALNSAKVMLVIGTKTEYFNAVWVKNEWSRYLKIMKQDHKKLLFPCFKNITAYELPNEFNHLQALDMGKIGFITDLIRGIKKIIVKEKPKKENVAGTNGINVPTFVPQQTEIATTYHNPLLRRAFIYIEDGEWKQADEQLEKFLDIEPENALAYLGKLLVDYRLKKQDEISALPRPIDNNLNYKKAYKFGDKTLKDALDSYNKIIIDRLEERNKERNYKEAIELLNSAKTESEFKKAGMVFKALSGYRDSASKINICFLKAEELRQESVFLKAKAFLEENDTREIVKAIPLLESIKGYKDAEELLKKVPTAIEEIKENNYNSAIKYLSSKTIAGVKEARKIFLSLDDYKDSAIKAKECDAKIFEVEDKRRQEKINREKSEVARKRAELERQEALEKRKKLIKISTVCGALMLVLIIILASVLPGKIRQNRWDDFSKSYYQEGYIKEKGYIYFGYYPQTIKDDDVILGGMDKDGYYQGSDGERYLKVTANPSISSYEFSNEELIVKGNTYYFKVEPIKWRILSSKNGKALLLSENIIDCKRYDKDNNNYCDSEIRAWLNGTFLDVAFSASQKRLINTVVVDNSEQSTGSYDNSYACNDTDDKVFLLSYEEARNSKYDFSTSTQDKKKAMYVSDYCRAIGGVMMNDNGMYSDNGIWWLRSPISGNKGFTWAVSPSGNVDYLNVYVTSSGVVPAIKITL